MVAYFNSIKVQLEPQGFHCVVIHQQFQFHKGTIRTTVAKALRRFDIHFNSIKVQLEPSIPSHQCPLSTVFQFHKGTIRTSDEQSPSHSLSYFNSIKVQLERGIHAARNAPCFISIP